MNPSATAVLLDNMQSPCGDVPVVPISSVGELFEVLGVSERTLAGWHERFGYDSGGVGDGGEWLARAFPVFGRMLDVLVDPVIVDPKDCEALAAECDADWLAGCGRERGRHLRGFAQSH